MIKLTEMEKMEKSPFTPLDFVPGIWVNGKCYWLQGIREKVIYDEELTVKVTLERTHSKIYYYHLFVSNHSLQLKKVKMLAVYNHPKLSDKQFSFASPADRTIFHLVNEDVYMVNGQCGGKGFKEYTVQPYWNLLSNQIWNSEEQGILKYQPMVKGPSVSILALDLSALPQETIKANTWVVHGKSKQEVSLLNSVLLKRR